MNSDGEIHVEASHLLRDATFEMRIHVIPDWRFRIGLWVMALGIRILGAVPKIEAIE